MMVAKRIYLSIILFIACLCFISCYSDFNDGGANKDTEHVELIVPESSNLGRDVVVFSEINYVRPDIAALKDKFISVYEIVEMGEASYDEMADAITDAGSDYDSFITAKTYAQIVSYSKTDNSRFQYELRYLNEVEPTINQLLEQLFVACATSKYAQRFENELLGAGLIEQYSGGSKLNAEVLELMTDEELLILEYEGLNPGTVEISYDGMTDTYSAVLSHLSEKYGKNSSKFALAKKECELLYAEKVSELSSDIFVELIKVRRKLAEALGYTSYIDYIYSERYTEYTPEQAGHLFDDISKYVVPVYISLANRVFNSNNRQPSPSYDRNAMMNTLGDIMKNTDEGLYEAYAFMLAYGLYDIDAARNDRFEGSFTAYLPSYQSPFMFVTLGDTIDDYMLFSHEFGHFFDMLENYGASAALDLSEVSSQALEFLMLTKLKGTLGDREYGKLFYGQIESVMLTLIYQAFYAKLEHIVYSLPYHEITLERVNEAVKEAAEAMSLNPSAIGGIEDVIISHLIIEPFYVQSYCTSAIVALGIFFAELSQSGQGFEMYHKLITRDPDIGFISFVELLNLPSPFDRGTVKQMADSIYFAIIGSHYFESTGDNNTALAKQNTEIYYYKREASAMCA